MRTIPPAMLASFQDQQGLQLFFIVEINWMGEELIKYSTCEFPDQDIYAYVKEFSNFESVSHVEGLGAVSSINVDFYDQFGHFKEKMDTVDFFNNTDVTVYLTLDGTELYDLFEGKISDSASWSNNIFSIEVLSKNIEKEVGYQPTLDDIDEEAYTEEFYAYLDRHLNTNGVWPAVFGTVKNYEIPAVWTQRSATTTEDVDYTPSGSYYDIPIEDHEDFSLDTDYAVNVTGKSTNAFSILGTGQFKTVGDQKIFRLQKASITSTWYQNINFEILDDLGISGEAEEPATRLVITPGPVTYLGEPVIVDDVELTTLGPDGEPTLDVWLQFMQLDIRYTKDTGIDVSTGLPFSTITASNYKNCVKQEGNTITLNEKFTLLEGARDYYIRKATKAPDIIYKIPSGSQIFIMGDTVSYVVDTKTDTVIDKISMKNGDELVTIDPAVYTVSSAPLWEGTHPEVLYITMQAEVYMRYLEHYALKDKEGEGVLCSAHNTYDTEAEAIAKLTGLDCYDDAPYNVNFVYLTVEDAQDIVPEIAWQANKAVRYTRMDNDDVLELIDLTDNDDPPLHTFTADNILLDSVKYGFTVKDDLYTVIKAEFQTNDLLKELKVIKYKKNVAKYEEVLLDVDYYIFKDRSVAEQHIKWWRDKLSQYYYTIEFTGFMDAFALEVWDRVAVQLDTATFYDPALGTPFVHTHTPSPQVWNALGRVKTISPNIEQGLIEFKIELDTIIGVSTTSPYAPEY